METVKFVLTANAGLLIDPGESRLLIDAFHSTRYEAYQTVSSELFSQILADPRFQDPDVCVYTHCHPDHFSAEMTAEASRQWPGMVTILPEQKAAGILLSRPEENFSVGKLDLTFRRLTHEGEQYKDVTHYGVLIRKGPLTILDAGDCLLGSEELASFIQGRHIDIAVLNFIWLTLRRGRQFIKEIIRPDHVLVCHLPDPDLDPYDYKRAAEIKIFSDFPDKDIRIISRPLQEEVICIE